MSVVFFIILLNLKCIFAEDSRKNNVFLKVSRCVDPLKDSGTSHRVTVDEECAVWCLETEGCKSYSLQSSTQMCYLYNRFLNGSGCLNDFTHYNSETAMIIPRCLNEGVYNQTTNKCRCFRGYVGDRCERLMQDCSEGLASGHYNDIADVFLIHPMTSSEPIRVLCKIAWVGKTIILRQNRRHPYVNFTRDWSDYKIGFGNVEKGSNFYIGNDIIHLITTNKKHRMVISVQNVGGIFQSFTYAGVQVDNETGNYRLTYENKWAHRDYPLGDCFPGNNISFSTIDRDNDADPGSCALTYMSGWWFDACGPCNPTGNLKPKSETHENLNPTLLHAVGAETIGSLSVSLHVKP